MSYLIWFSGKTSLSIVDLSNLSTTEVKGFFPTIGSDFATPKGCLGKQEGEVLMVIFEFQEMDNICYFAKGRNPDCYLVVDKFKYSNFFSFI